MQPPYRGTDFALLNAHAGWDENTTRLKYVIDRTQTGHCDTCGGLVRYGQCLECGVQGDVPDGFGRVRPVHRFHRL